MNLWWRMGGWVKNDISSKIEGGIIKMAEEEKKQEEKEEETKEDKE